MELHQHLKPQMTKFRNEEMNIVQVGFENNYGKLKEKTEQIYHFIK